MKAGGVVVKMSKLVLTLGLCFSILLNPLLVKSNPDTEKTPQEAPAPYKTDDNKERYFDPLDYRLEIDWKSAEIEKAIEYMKIPHAFFDDYLYAMGFYDIDFSLRNRNLREKIARTNPGRENDFEFLIDEIIDENAWDAMEMGFVAGGLAEAALARLGKKASDLQGKYKNMAAFLGKTAMFASIDALITTQYFLNSYFQIANLLGWTKGNVITREDAKKFFFQTSLYALYVYGADVTFAAGLQTLGKKFLNGMGTKKYIAAAEMEKLGTGLSFMLNMAFSKNYWREFWGLNLRTVGWNEGRKRAFWHAVSTNVAQLERGESSYAGYLATTTSPYAKVFHIFTQGGISALHSYLGVKYGMKGLIKFFYPPVKAPQYGASDFKKLVDSGIIFKLMANSISSNTSSVQGVYSERQRAPIEETFAAAYQAIYHFEGERFKTSPFYLELKTKIENKEPFILTKQEKELYYSVNTEAKLIAYLLCYYFFAYDGFSITDSHNLQQTSHVQFMFEEKAIEYNEIQLFYTMQEQFGQQLFSERKLFAQNPLKYTEDKQEPFPEKTALHYLINTNIVPPDEVSFNDE